MTLPPPGDAEGPQPSSPAQHRFKKTSLRATPFRAHGAPNHFRRQLNPAPKIDIAVVDDCIRFSVFISKEVSAEDLCKLDDAVYNAVRGVGRAIDGEQTALDQKLDQVRKRRMDAWDESYFR